jgi:dTDP-4-amino-4,6-dideoxygalactose transaminase
MLGTAGRFSTLSFHETKNFICGEGGALVLNRSDDVERAHVVYHKGTNRRAFGRGDVDKYTWVDTGSSFGLSDVLAAFLYGQLLQRDEIVRKRRAASQRYHSLLAPRCADLGLELINVPEDCVRADHLFAVLAPDREVRDRILRRMQTQGVHATFHYVPLHESPGGRAAAARLTHCPVSTEIAGRLLRLPFYTDLTDDEAERVVETLITAVEAG